MDKTVNGITIPEAPKGLPKATRARAEKFLGAITVPTTYRNEAATFEKEASKTRLRLLVMFGTLAERIFAALEPQEKTIRKWHLTTDVAPKSHALRATEVIANHLALEHLSHEDSFRSRCRTFYRTLWRRAARYGMQDALGQVSSDGVMQVLIDKCGSMSKPVFLRAMQDATGGHTIPQFRAKYAQDAKERNTNGVNKGTDRTPPTPENVQRYADGFISWAKRVSAADEKYVAVLRGVVASLQALYAGKIKSADTSKTPRRARPSIKAPSIPKAHAPDCGCVVCVGKRAKAEQVANAVVV